MHQTPNTQPYRNSTRNSQPLLFKYTESKFIYRVKMNMFNASLSWIKSKQVFLKIQAGTGDNLLQEDIQKGFVDYCLWSIFKPECIDIDGELDMECIDSGMVLSKEYFTLKTALESCYYEAFGGKYNEGDIVVLIKESS